MRSASRAARRSVDGRTCRLARWLSILDAKSWSSQYSEIHMPLIRFDPGGPWRDSRTGHSRRHNRTGIRRTLEGQRGSSGNVILQPGYQSLGLWHQTRDAKMKRGKISAASEVWDIWGFNARVEWGLSQWQWDEARGQLRMSIAVKS